jgi:predicted esterase
MATRRSGFALAVCVALSPACSRTSTARAPEPEAQRVAVTDESAAPPSRKDPPQKNQPAREPVPAPKRPPAFAELDVPGFERAVVSFPTSAPLPQPVLVSTHGAGDTPGQMCELWRAILGDRGVVLCPAGPRMRAHEEGRYYPDHHALESITFAALRALAEAYPEQADAARAVYTGYSQGATMGALMIASHGGECPRLVLAEGGFDDWTLEGAATFKHGGGDRVLFICGRQRCKSAAERSAALLRSAGVEARVVSHVGEGHVVHIAELAMPELGWLLEGDPRWGT